MATKNDAVEVVVSWDGNPLDTTVVRGEGALRIGPGAGVWFSLPVEALSTDHTLLAKDGESWVLAVPAGATINAAKCGERVACESRLVLEPSMTAEIKVGRFSFFVRTTDAAIERTPKHGGSYRWTTWLGVAGVLHAIALGFFALLPRDAAALNLDPNANDSRYINVALNAEAMREPEPVRTTAVQADAGNTDPGASSANAEQGEQGHEGEAVQPEQSSTNAPRRDHGRFQPTFIPNPTNLSEVGPLAVLLEQSWGDNQGPYSMGNMRPGEGGLAEMARLLMPPGGGWAYLDHQGDGHGTCDPRRERCENGISVGPLTTNNDPGPGNGDIGMPDREPRDRPDWHPLPPEVVGGLSREQVRRTIRQHINEVRFCYEQALVRRPDLEGRVAVSFIISPSGSVQSASSTSTVNDNRIATCVEQRVRTWDFPSSQGATGVTYPFIMQSAD
jgi:hypothetical protein